MDPLKVISNVTGLSKQAMDAIWQQVKANNELLNKCSGHDFSVMHEKRGECVHKWKCAHCGGIVDRIAKRWYELGLKHGKPASS